MVIKINFPCEIKRCEGKFELSLQRERLDYKNLLQELNNGKTLNEIFKNQQIADSIRNQLSSAPLYWIDKNDRVLSDGLEFINNPYKSENESGVYTISYTSLNINNKNLNIILKMNRSLDKNQCSMIDFNFDNFILKNDIKMDDNEIIKIVNIKNLVGSKVFSNNCDNGNICFDACNNKYVSKYGEYNTGDELKTKIKDEILTIVKNNFSYIEMYDDLNFCYINSLDDLTDLDKKTGFINNLNFENLEISKLPFKIKTMQLAREYVYWYLYDKINSGEYLSLDDMNDLLQNEILCKDIFDSSIIEKLYNLNITMAGFKENLPDSIYQKLLYRLNVMKILLDVEIGHNKYSNFSSYYELVNYFKEELDFNSVKRLYMVMGYPYAKNLRNKIIDCIKEFKNNLENIVIIKKQPVLSNQKENLEIKNELLDMNVMCYESADIHSSYHDRFLIFEMNNCAKIYLISCEIGEFFTESKESRGYIYPIDLSNTIRNGKNLLQYVKECK